MRVAEITHRFSGLDLLRLFAALMVVTYHYTFHGPGAFELTWLSLPDAAVVTRYFYMGVPLFFVISGFVIAYSAAGRTVLEFARSRFARIYPTFVVCMSITFAVAALFGQPEIDVSFHQWLANLLVVAPLLKQSYVDTVYWSIVYEITFYGLIAILLWLRLFDTRLLEVVGVWLLISLCNELLFGSEVLRRLLITNYSGFFASGILMFLAMKGGRDLRITSLFVLSVALGALQADLDANWLRERGVELSHWIVVLLAVAAPFVAAACVTVERQAVSSSVCLAFGGLTYPLYLMHQTIGYIIFNHMRWFGRPALLVLGTVMAMVLLSWMFYLTVDRPLHASVNGALKKLLGRWTRGCVRPLPVAAE
jgi:peptidoglycan/LPS O-acetylase OafA/YrhL